MTIVGIIEAVPGDAYVFRCLVCTKTVSCRHQGEADMKRHVNGKHHQANVRSKSQMKSLDSLFVKKDSETDRNVRKAELKFTGFLAEHNLPLAAADHLGSLIRTCFPDSKIAQSYACARTKASCLLNDAIAPDLMKSLVDDMMGNFFSLCVDGSNDQDLLKMNPLTVRIYDVNQRKVCCKFLDMCVSDTSTADGIFGAIDKAITNKHHIPWSNCVGFGVDNTSVNVGRHNSIMTRVLAKNDQVYFMGCPCHMAHNAARKATAAFCKALPGFDVEELLVDTYFWFEYSSKRKNVYAEYCKFVDMEYRRVLKFMSVRWLGLSTCLERVLRQYEALKSYFLSTSENDRGCKARLERLCKFFESPVNELHLLFLHACLAPYTSFNLLLQREDPVLPIMHASMIDMLCVLFGRFLKPEVVSAFRAKPCRAFKSEIAKAENQLDDDRLFVGFINRQKVHKLLDQGDISAGQHSNFFTAARLFHAKGAEYALQVLPVDDEVLQHAGVLNFLDKSKYSFTSVVYLADRFRSHLQFTQDDLNNLETEFMMYQCMQLSDLSINAKSDATIKITVADHDDTVSSYRLDVLWHYLFTDNNVAGTSRSKFTNLMKIAKLILTLPHSNADEERVFSLINKNKTKFRPNLSTDRTIPSIITFQLNRSHDEPCFKYEPNAEVCKAARHVTWDYNKAHSSLP
jgi:hypothetical protein